MRWVPLLFSGAILAACTSPAAPPVIAPCATTLAIVSQPTSYVVGEPFTVTVRAETNGELATCFTGTVQVVGAGQYPPLLPGETRDPPLLGTLEVPAVAGVATFNDLVITLTGPFTLRFTADSLEADSSSFEVDSPPPPPPPPDADFLRLVFFTQPGFTVVGKPIAPSPVVCVLNGASNTDTTFGGVITIELTTSNATLSGTTALAAVKGCAEFSNLLVDLPGEYVLQARTDSAVSAISTVFVVYGNTGLAFTTQPTTTVVGMPITPAVVVCRLDPFGNVDTSFNGPITISINEGILHGTVTKSAVAGCAVFADLSIDVAGTNYRLSASAEYPFVTAISYSFDVVNP